MEEALERDRTPQPYKSLPLPSQPSFSTFSPGAHMVPLSALSTPTGQNPVYPLSPLELPTGESPWTTLNDTRLLSSFHSHLVLQWVL